MPDTKRDKYNEEAEKIQALYHQGVYAGDTEKISAILRSAFPPPAEDARALVQAWMDQGLPLMYQEPIALASDISRFAQSRVEPWREALREAVDLLNASQDYWTQEDWDDVSRFGKMLSDSPAKDVRAEGILGASQPTRTNPYDPRETPQVGMGSLHDSPAKEAVR